MAAAFGAVLPLAERCLLERRDVLGARRDSYGVRLPEAEGVHRSSRPRATGLAVAVSHGFGRAGDFEFDRTAKTASRVRHRWSSRLSEVGSVQAVTPDGVRYSAEHAALWNRAGDGPVRRVHRPDSSVRTVGYARGLSRRGGPDGRSL